MRDFHRFMFWLSVWIVICSLVWYFWHALVICDDLTNLTNTPGYFKCVLELRK